MYVVHFLIETRIYSRQHISKVVRFYTRLAGLLDLSLNSLSILLLAQYRLYPSASQWIYWVLQYYKLFYSMPWRCARVIVFSAYVYEKRVLGLRSTVSWHIVLSSFVVHLYSPSSSIPQFLMISLRFLACFWTSYFLPSIYSENVQLSHPFPIERRDM